MELSQLLKVLLTLSLSVDARYANTSPKNLPVVVTVSNPAYQQAPDKTISANTEPDDSLEIGKILLQTEG